MNTESIFDLNLKEGMVILYKSEYTTTGLIVSKSSKILRDLIEKFSKEFEKRFLNELKESESEKSKFEIGNELVEDYFSVFPSRIIGNKKQQLFFSNEYLKIPADINNKLLEIIKDEKEYEFIKCELQRSPEKVSKEFFSLYNELKKEIEEN